MAWHIETLGDLCKFENGDRGSNYPSKDKLVKHGLPFVNAGHINDGNINFRDMNYITQEHFKKLSRGKYRFGDVLFCLRGSLGKFAKVETNESGAIASSLVILRPKHRLHVDYLLFYFRSKLCERMIKKFAGGAAQPNLGAKDLAKFEIPVPQLSEQKQIVAILDQAFANIDNARQLAESNLKNARELFNGTLNQIFTQNIDGWKSTTIGEVCNIINGSTPKRTEKKYWDNGAINWFTIDDIREQGRVIRRTKQKVTEQGLKSTSMKLLPPNAVLLCCTASVGEYAITKVELTTNQQFNGLVIKDGEALLPMFLFHFVKLLKPKLLSQSGRTTIDFVSMTKLRNIPFYYPSIETQREVAQKLDQLNEHTQSLEKIYQQKITALDELKQSLLQKAFRGELTQDQAAA